MASRVNIKFVVILSVSLVALAACAGGAFVFVQKASGPRLVRLGDKAMAKGDYKAADVHYSKAVNKQRTNVEWLKKWREAREKRVPESQTVFDSEYSLYVHGILRQLAVVQRNNVDAHREYLDAIYQQFATAGAGREAWQHLITETETSLKFLEPDAPGAVRRFRGLAISAMLANGFEVPAEVQKTGQEDLEAAFAADPRDAVAGTELAAMHQMLSERARQADRRDVAATELAAAEQVIQRVVAANPEEPQALTADLSLKISNAFRATESAKGAEAVRLRTAAMELLRPDLERVTASLTKPGAKPSSAVLQRYVALASIIDSAEGLKKATQVAEQCARARENDPEMIMLMGQLRLMGGDFDGALSEYERMSKLPDPTVGLEGLKTLAMRRVSHVARADVAASAALNAKTDEERASLLNRAKQFRAEAAKHVPETSPELAFVDGKVLFLERDYRNAQRKLDDLLKSKSLRRTQLSEGMRLMAEIGQRVQPPQPGLTREYLAKALELEPSAVDLRLFLAQTELSLDNVEAAANLLRQALEIDPNNAAAKEQLALTLARLNQGSVSDPVLAKLVEVEKIWKGDKGKLGDTTAAIAALEASLDSLNYDNRLLSTLISLRAASGDLQAVLPTIAAARQKRPDDEALKRLEERVQASGTLEGVLSLVERSEAPALEKAMTKYRVYLQYGKPAEAEATLAELERLAPEDDRVLELRFLNAMAKNNRAEAQALAEKAVANDADRAEGDTFRARLLLHDGKPRDAATLLQRAADRGNASPAVHRLLGMTYMQMGRAQDAVKSLRRALELNPTDVDVLKLCIGAMVRAGDTPAALSMARTSELVRRDPSLRNAWLGLETQAGNTQYARDMREQILQREPKDADNGAALAELYMSERRWDDARKLIDTLRAGGDSLTLVALDANWHAAKGDWVRGRQVYIDHIVKLKGENKLTADSFVSLAQYLLSQGQIDLAIESLRNGAPLQDPKTLMVDRSLADLYFASARFAEAEELYRRLSQADLPDAQAAARKRLIEALLQQGKHADVAAEFQRMGAAAEADPELLCLMAENLRLQGDERGAREALDRAVARHPEDPLAYYRRARLLLGQTSPLMTDVMADLNSAIRLRSGFIPALRTRAMLYLAESRSSEAIADLKAASAAQPNNEQFIRELLTAQIKAGNVPDAVVTADGVLKARAGDPRTAVVLGEVFATEKRWQEAANFYKRAWEQAKGEIDAGRYVAALLEMSPPRIADAEAVLATPELNLTRSANLLMTRAAVRKKQNRMDQARADALAAMQVSGNPELTLAWVEQVRRIFPEEGVAIQIVAALKGIAPLEPWLDLGRASILIAAPNTRAEGMTLLRTAATSGANDSVKLAAIKTLSSCLAQDKAWQEAYDVTKSGLQIAPDDILLTNNAAYFLATGLEKGSEAVPLAEKAAAAAPRQGGIVETLAASYWAAGQKEKAIEAMERAIRLAPSDLDRLTWMIKLGQWRLETGDRKGAERAMRLVRDGLVDSPGVSEQIKEPLEAFRQKLGAS
jgi:tetratricopeptide (TPR) repeat protein